MKKRFILFAFLLVLFTNSIVAETTEIYLFSDPKPPGPKPLFLTRPLSSTYISISASINDMDLSVYFGTSVGTATITVYDASNQITYQEAINTNNMTEVVVPTDPWDSGTYAVTISYGATIMRGSFDIP